MTKAQEKTADELAKAGDPEGEGITGPVGGVMGSAPFLGLPDQEQVTAAIRRQVEKEVRAEYEDKYRGYTAPEKPAKKKKD